MKLEHAVSLEIKPLTNNQITDIVLKDGYFVAKNNKVMSLINTISSFEWDTFSDSWNDLDLDNYMSDRGTYRYRRHAVFTCKKYTKDIIQLHNVPHYQSSQYNALNGDIERWYKPIENKIVGSSTFGLLIEHAMKIFNLCEINHLLDNWLSWYIEVHQFRIIANDNMDGKPTPEGIHKDGVSYIFMLPICKKNIAGGISTIYNNNLTPLSSIDISVGDLAYIDDSKVYHGVSEIKPINKDEESIRDMLVITFKKVN